jgi:hypothetical protein
MNDKLIADDHVSSVLTSCTGLLYALRVRRSHGIPDQSLHDIFNAVIVAKITYCAPSWSGACSAADKNKIDIFVNKAKRLVYCSKDLPTITELFNNAANLFFARILSNSEHLLHQFLPERLQVDYSLRELTENNFN